MSHCGLNHPAVYHRNTGRWPNATTIKKLDKSCESWKRELDHGSEHVIISRFWNAHLADLGSNSH